VVFCAPPTADAPGGAELVVEARMDGRVIRETRGSGGFGYDVLFEALEFPGRTTAELEPGDKDSVSHRGRALREIAPQIAALLGPRAGL
jgi:XTP/dITP diphosphohydrolase